MHMFRGIVRVAAAVAFLGLLVATDGAARGGDAPRAIDVIENDLVADVPAVRAKAAAELTDRFPDGAVAVPMLVDLLDDESPDVVAAAARAIDSMAVAGVSVLAEYGARDGTFDIVPLSPYETGYASWTPSDIAHIAFGTSTYDSVEPWLVAVLRRGDSSKRTLAAAALAMQGAAALNVKGIAPTEDKARTKAASAALTLVNGDDDHAWRGVRLLGWLRSSDTAVIAALIERVAPPTPRSASIGTQNEACRALGAIRPHSEAAAAALLGALSRRETARVAADALIRMGRSADVAERLAQHSLVSNGIASALAERRVESSTVVPYLIVNLGDGRRTVHARSDAADDLAAYGPLAGGALPVLRQFASESSDAFVKLRCAGVILAIAPADADSKAVVDDALAHPTKTRTGTSEGHAWWILACCAQPTQSVAEQLRRYLSAVTTSAAAGGESDSLPIAAIVDGLRRFGPAAKPVVPDLVRLLGALFKGCSDVKTMPESCDLRRRVVLALGAIGPDAAAAITELEALTKSADVTIRIPAAQALRRIRTKK